MSLLGKLIKNTVSETLNKASDSLGKAVSDSVGKAVSESVGKAVSDSVGKAVSGIAENVAGKDGVLENAAKYTQGLNEALKQSAEEAGIDLSRIDLNEVKASLESAAQSMSQASGEDYSVELPEDSEDVNVKLKKVLADEFPACEVKEQVSPLTIGAWGKPMNYSYGIYKEGKPALFIMIVGRATTRNRTYRWAKEAAAKAGVPMINLVEHYPNRYKYISETLHKYL